MGCCRRWPLALLSTIALWPEFDRATEQARAAFRRVSAEIQGGQLVDARYHGIDEKGRPVHPDRRHRPAGRAGARQPDDPEGRHHAGGRHLADAAGEAGRVHPAHQQLDLSHDVTLYRDDGTTLVTASAAIDLKNGAAAGAEPVHAEGPFGTLDAQGFTLVDKGANIQFAGPAHWC